MRIGTSLTLITVGAILTFAVHAHLQVLSFFAVGVILMLVGAIGQVLSQTGSTRQVTVARTRQQATDGRAPATSTMPTPATVSSEPQDDGTGDTRPAIATTDGGSWSSPRPQLRVAGR